MSTNLLSGYQYIRSGQWDYTFKTGFKDIWRDCAYTFSLAGEPRSYRLKPTSDMRLGYYNFGKAVGCLTIALSLIITPLLGFAYNIVKLLISNHKIHHLMWLLPSLIPFIFIVQLAQETKKYHSS